MQKIIENQQSPRKFVWNLHFENQAAMAGDGWKLNPLFHLPATKVVTHVAGILS